jgi:hypothetical protein
MRWAWIGHAAKLPDVPLSVGGQMRLDKRRHGVVDQRVPVARRGVVLPEVAEQFVRGRSFIVVAAKDEDMSLRIRCHAELAARLWRCVACRGNLPAGCSGMTGWLFRRAERDEEQRDEHGAAPAQQ